MNTIIRCFRFDTHVDKCNITEVINVHNGVSPLNSVKNPQDVGPFQKKSNSKKQRQYLGEMISAWLNEKYGYIRHRTAGPITDWHRLPALAA